MTNPLKVFFDDSLPLFIKIIQQELGQVTVEAGVFLRDAEGRLRFISNSQSSSENERRRIELIIVEALGVYAATDRLLIYNDDDGADALLNDPSILPVEVSNISCQLIDRRIVGSGWLESPRDEEASPPRIVFASLKGGVGRSTALAVTAADLARRNQNILVVDLDLEAPGLGSILLDDERLPRFGVIDFLVENKLSPITDDLLNNFIGTSSLTKSDGGRIDVLPAIGKTANANYENVLPKLARAMIDGFTNDGEIISVSSQINDMISRFSVFRQYDVVLIDSRAGLSELSASTLLGLGATILLFGTAQKQTIQGYNYLMSGLKLLAERDLNADISADWRFRFKAVYAKSSFNDNIANNFRDDLYELFAANLYNKENFDLADDNEESFGIDDTEAPHWPLIIPFNQNFVDFDPVIAPNQLTYNFYELAFRPFIDGINAIIEARVAEKIS
jgi:MinD-like ATPase involved in chromosome partitioning or flagellar assembly